MTITIDTQNPRSVKALEICAEAGQWMKCRGKNGEKAYGIRSSRDPNHVYFVTSTTCSCYDSKERGNECKHRQAVKLFVALTRAVQPVRRMPVSTRED